MNNNLASPSPHRSILKHSDGAHNIGGNFFKQIQALEKALQMLGVAEEELDLETVRILASLSRRRRSYAASLGGLSDTSRSAPGKRNRASLIMGRPTLSKARVTSKRASFVSDGSRRRVSTAGGSLEEILQMLI